MGGRFISDIPELAELRVCRVKGFPNHLIFYIEHHAAIEIVRILHGAMDSRLNFAISSVALNCLPASFLRGLPASFALDSAFKVGKRAPYRS